MNHCWRKAIDGALLWKGTILFNTVVDVAEVADVLDANMIGAVALGTGVAGIVSAIDLPARKS